MWIIELKKGLTFTANGMRRRRFTCATASLASMVTFMDNGVMEWWSHGGLVQTFRTSMTPFVAEGEGWQPLCSLVLAGLHSQLDGSFVLAGICIVAQIEPDFLADALHRVVFGQDVTDDPLQLFVAADPDEGAEQLGAHAQVVPLVADEQSELALVGVVNFAQAANAEDFVLARLGVLVIHDQGNLTVVIVEANPRQPLMGYALGQVHQTEKAVINALL